MTPSDPVTARLLAARIELLDLSLRNQLLNWKLSKRRGAEIVDEKSAQVFAALLSRTSLRFHHTREPSAAEAGAPADAPVGVGELNPENSLAAPYTKDDLHRRLLATYQDAWLVLQEQGANTLFLALGMLRWREADRPQDVLAPLVLYPVHLDRKSARANWQLVASEEDPGVNLSLVEKLKEFGLKLPSEPDLETVDHLDAWFKQVEECVAGKSGWQVERDRIALGFFSFGKFLMYRDLDPAMWRDECAPARHPLLAALLHEGFRDPGPALAANETLDLRRAPGTVMEVMDADSSQAEVLHEVALGRSLVVQGPPGTGKSQTISNMIAEAVQVGKRVLFVAEKLAALDVVKRRMENVGLGELCLELHSDKASKKSVIAEMTRCLSLGRPEAPADAPLVDGLPEHRDTLNRYVAAAAQPVGNSATTPYDAIGITERLLQHPRELRKLAHAPMSDWTKAQYHAAQAAVADLARKITELGVPARHPYDGCCRAEILPGEEERIAKVLDVAIAAGNELAAAAFDLSRELHVGAAADSAALEAQMRFAELLLQAPDLRGLPPIGAAWDRVEDVRAFDQAIRNVAHYRDTHAKYDAKFLPEAWTADLLAARRDLIEYGSSFWRWLFNFRLYGAARRAVQSFCKAPLPQGQLELLHIVDAVMTSKRLTSEVHAQAQPCRALAGDRWRGVETAEDLAPVAAWASRFRAALAPLGVRSEFESAIVGKWDRENVRRTMERARATLAAWRAACAQAVASLSYAKPWDMDLATRVKVWRDSLSRLSAYVAYWRLHENVSRFGLAELADLAHAGSLAPDDAAPALERAWAWGILERAFRERPELKQFDAATHEQTVGRFRRADAATFRVNRARLADLHWRGLPPNVGYGQIGLLRRECAKKARHLPIRRLMEQAGAALQSVKPVFLMSPLSVAAYLSPDGPTFDLVIFDEASQVKPVDAFGSILRGAQLVVVGDEKQLPPTSFFDALLSSEGVVDEEEAAANVTADLQSIIGLCASRGMPSRMLRWHYRSRHDSLIALSNREFYQDRLVVFPSPRRGQEGEGLSLRHLPHTVYQRGTTRANPLEADAVCQAVVEHTRARPHLTLGVVAFSQAQRGAIDERIEAHRRKDGAFDTALSANREEPFFVKNLENVQGDERDVILISAGYGRDETGKISMNFGPLNQAGGERRLNVLITRARWQCVVFTNITADDLDIRRAPGEGVKAFKAFLAFAQGRGIEHPADAAVDPDAEFESQVRAALAKAGYAVEQQVGSGGYRVDLAVADPSQQGRYMLGIECDGTRYLSARWARDRDRLRSSVLQNLGWNLHRVWSTDWFRNRDDALRRCIEAIERAKVPAEAARPAPPPSVRRVAHETPPPPPPVPAYQPARAEAKLGESHLDEIDPRELAAFVASIVEQESPLHVEELERRVLGAIEGRASQRRLDAIRVATGEAASRGMIRRDGEFLWRKDQQAVEPRDRSGQPDASRALEYVCDAEAKAALKRVVEEARGCDGDDAAVQAIRVLGVKRNDAATARLKALLSAMVQEHVLAAGAVGTFLARR